MAFILEVPARPLETIFLTTTLQTIALSCIIFCKYVLSSSISGNMLDSERSK